MAQEEAREVYQLHILLLKISPAIWRRVLVPSDQSLADLHHILQIVMGWDDTHLHRFLIHGKTHGISREGGLWFRSDPKQIRLRDLHLRLKERFLYEAKGIALRIEPKKTKKRHRQIEEEEEPSASIPTIEELEHQLERMKWYLWHGNVFRASQIGEDLEEDLELPEEKNASVQKMLRAVREFNGSITANENDIVNYGDRYRNGENHFYRVCRINGE